LTFQAVAAGVPGQAAAASVLEKLLAVDQSTHWEVSKVRDSCTGFVVVCGRKRRCCILRLHSRKDEASNFWIVHSPYELCSWEHQCFSETIGLCITETMILLLVAK
jgi:hypothetical protein